MVIIKIPDYVSFNKDALYFFQLNKIIEEAVAGPLNY